MRRRRGWATTQHHLPSLLSVVATDQSKLPKDNGGQLLCKVVGRNRPDQLNNDNTHCQMGGGGDLDGAIAENNTHWRRGDQEDDQIGPRHNATTTTKTAMKEVDDHNKEDPPQGGEIRKEGQGKEEGLVSAKEVCRAAIQVDNGNAVFLLMAEMTVTTMAASSLSLGAGTTTIILGLLLP